MVLLGAHGSIVSVALGDSVHVFIPTTASASKHVVVKHGDGVVVRDFSICEAHKLLATVGDDKTVKVVNIESGSVVLSQTFPKKLTCVKIVSSTCDSEGCRVVVGDRQGFVFTVGTKTKQVQQLLGHTASLITGLALSPHNDTFLLSADRDEKVRVSHFPKTFDIQGFLLGHGKFVTEIVTGTFPGASTADTETFVGLTGSGDGKLRIWELPSCRKLSTVDIAHDSSTPLASIAYSPRTGLVAATAENSSVVHLHRLTFVANGDGGVSVDVEVLVPIDLTSKDTDPAEPLVCAFDAQDNLLVVNPAGAPGTRFASFVPVGGSEKAEDQSAAGFALKPCLEGSQLSEKAQAINSSLKDSALNWGTFALIVLVWFLGASILCQHCNASIVTCYLLLISFNICRRLLFNTGPSRVWRDPNTESTLFDKHEVAVDKRAILNNLRDRAAGNKKRKVAETASSKSGEESGSADKKRPNP